MCVSRWDSPLLPNFSIPPSFFVFFCFPCFFSPWIWNVISPPCNRIKRTRYCCAAGYTLRKKISSLPLWPGALPWEPTGLIWTSTAAFASAGVTVKQSICVTTHGPFCWFTGGYNGIISLCFKQSSIIQSFLAFCVGPVVWHPGPGATDGQWGNCDPFFPSENIFQIIELFGLVISATRLNRIFPYSILCWKDSSSFAF